VKKVLIIGPSLLDELGHFEYINEISKGISSSYDVSTVCQSYPESLLNKKEFDRYKIIQKDFLDFPNKKNSSENTINFKSNNLFSYIFPIYRRVKFYWSFYKYASKKKGHGLLMLEVEPILLFIFLIFHKLNYKKIIITLHAVDFDSHSGIKNIYKKILRALIKGLSSKIDKFAVHSKGARRRLQDIGIPSEKIFISGWGFNPKPSQKKENKNKISVLSFGVLRKQKRLDLLTQLFLDADTSKLQLKIIGKCMDTNLVKLKQMIRASNSSTSIAIEDRYVPEDDVDNIFFDSDIVVLSHDKSFSSVSGPLFQAISYKKPILCFSYNDVRDLVHEEKLGTIVDFDKVKPDELESICLELLQNNAKPNFNFFSWDNISERIAEELK